MTIYKASTQSGLEPRPTRRGHGLGSFRFLVFGVSSLGLVNRISAPARFGLLRLPSEPSYAYSRLLV